MRVFVASATADSEWVEELRSVLRDSVGSAWAVLEPLPLHPDWRDYAREAIAQADAFLFVTSPTAAVSQYCAWELATALDLGKPCFQWIVEPVDGEYDAASLPVLKVGSAEDATNWRFETPGSSP